MQPRQSMTAPEPPDGQGSDQTASDSAALLARLDAAFTAHTLGQLSDAEGHYRAILAADSRNFHALQLLGTLEAQRFRDRKAERLWRLALDVRPNSALVAGNLALVLHRAGRNAEALGFAERALAAEPADLHARHHRASILQSLRRLDEAIRSAEDLLALSPDYPFARGLLVQMKREACDWRGLGESVAALVEEVRAGKPAIAPFSFLALSDSPADQRMCAKTYADRLARPPKAIHRGVRRGDRIRLAYLSADFHDHPTAYLAAGLFESHDRSRFEVSAISFDGPRTGPLRRRLMGAFDRFVDVTEIGDSEAAQRIADLEIDIAIDLKGYTKDARPGILECRPASLQVSYLGYPGTLASPAIDYLIADATVVPSGHRLYFSEKIVTLPGSYQVNDRLRPSADPARAPVTRRDAGLPERGFVFACFASAYKITPEMFDVWMSLLREIEGSVLWLLATNPAAVANLPREAEARGVAAERLVFALPAPAGEHLARHRLADLFLDTLPYGTHTGASDALWPGVPLVTCLGNAFAGRVAASLLRAADLPELVTATLDDYQALAGALARDRPRLSALRQRLADRRDRLPLFDTKLFCRRIETAFSMMMERHDRGEPPADFSVPQ